MERRGKDPNKFPTQRGLEERVRPNPKGHSYLSARASVGSFVLNLAVFRWSDKVGGKVTVVTVALFCLFVVNIVLS